MEVGELIKTEEEHVIINGNKIHIIRRFIHDPERLQRGYEALREVTIRNILERIKEG